MTWSALLPAFATGLLSVPTAARPLTTIARRPAAIENARTLPIETARQLLGAQGRAEDLEYRPPHWDWTTPVTVQLLGQVTAPATIDNS